MFEIRRPLVGALLALCACTTFASRSIAPPALVDESAQTHQGDDRTAMALFPGGPEFSPFTGHQLAVAT